MEERSKDESKGERKEVGETTNLQQEGRLERVAGKVQIQKEIEGK